MAQSQHRSWRWNMILWYQLIVNYLCLGRSSWLLEGSLISPGDLTLCLCHTVRQPRALGGSRTSCSAPVQGLLQSWGWHCPFESSNHFLNANVFNTSVVNWRHDWYRLCNEVIIGLVLKISVAQSYAIFYYGNVGKCPFLPSSHNFSQQSPVCFMKIAAKIKFDRSLPILFVCSYFVSSMKNPHKFFIHKMKRFIIKEKDLL